MEGNRRAKRASSSSDSDSSSDESSIHPHFPDMNAGQKKLDEVPHYYSAHINSVCNAINTQVKKRSTASLDKLKLARRRESNRISARQRRQQRKDTIKRLGQELRRLELESVELTAEKERLQVELQREASGSFVPGTTSPQQMAPMPQDNHRPAQQLFQQQSMLLQQNQLQHWQHFTPLSQRSSREIELQRVVSGMFVAGTTNPLELASMPQEDQRPMQQLLEQQSFLLQQQHQLQLQRHFTDLGTTSPQRSTQLSQQVPSQWLFQQQPLPLQHINHQPPLQRHFPAVTPISLASLARLLHVHDVASSLPYDWPNPHLDQDFERLLLGGAPPVGLGRALPSLIRALADRRDTAPPRYDPITSGSNRPNSEDLSLPEPSVHESRKKSGKKN